MADSFPTRVHFLHPRRQALDVTSRVGECTNRPVADVSLAVRNSRSRPRRSLQTAPAGRFLKIRASRSQEFELDGGSTTDKKHDQHRHRPEGFRSPPLPVPLFQIVVLT